MACSHPLFAYQESPGSRPVIIKYHDFLGQKYYVDKFGLSHDIIQLPCGQCVQCRLQYSRNWADRCMLEAQKYENNEFLTLTYDDEHLPHSKRVDLQTGEFVGEAFTLVPKDLQDFLKRLRQAFARGKYRVNHYDYFDKEKIISSEVVTFPKNKNIRFYACGEYGDKYARPHYHIIVFNLTLNDKQFLFTNKQGTPNFASDLIRTIWSKGHITLCPVTWETCAYTARYVMKKQKGPHSAEYYAERGVLPEFVRMSRKPGIARDYYEQNKADIYWYDAIYLKKGSKVEKIRPSRYYDKLFDVDEHEYMEALKRRRKEMANILLQSKLDKTDLSEREFLIMNEKLTLERVKQLKRNFENETQVI